MEKYKIEKDSIQETFVISLYGRRTDASADRPD